MGSDLNLNPRRRLFPLKLMTMLAMGESTLGSTAKSVADAPERPAFAAGSRYAPRP